MPTLFSGILLFYGIDLPFVFGSIYRFSNWSLCFPCLCIVFLDSILLHYNNRIEDYNFEFHIILVFGYLLRQILATNSKLLYSQHFV